MISIGITEDMDDYRNLLTVLLNNTNEMKVVFSAASAEETIKKIKDGQQPDLCLIDIGLPGISGISLVEWIRSHAKNTLCLICTSYDSNEKVFNSLEAGAHGYILKSTSPAGIVDSVLDIIKGGSPMSSEIARKVVSAFSKIKSLELNNLTSRENEILNLLSKGLFYKEIASRLEISIETVKRHCFNIYQKLHVQNRTEALNKFKG